MTNQKTPQTYLIYPHPQQSWTTNPYLIKFKTIQNSLGFTVNYIVV